jgi:hypothetical protein
MNGTNDSALKKSSDTPPKDRVVLERLTKSFLRKIRENDSSNKKQNLKVVFREVLEKEKF